jgi:NAD-dependent deacetylase sirtuin 5
LNPKAMSMPQPNDTPIGDSNISSPPQATGPELTISFKDELRKQFFARDQREKPALDSLLTPSSSVFEEQNINLASPDDFPAYLATSKRILCLVGAGLSVSSGIATFRDERGKDKFWRDYQVSVLSSSRFFVEDPIVSWWYHADRRQASLKANPNSGHRALVQLAEKKDRMLIVSQNIDGLLERAGLAEERLINLHGSLFSLHCANSACSYTEQANYQDPQIPALTIPATEISTLEVPLPSISKEDLPHCPTCKTNLVRPGILWFGENVPKSKLAQVDAFLQGEKDGEQDGKVDLMIVVGTSAMVWPAADFIHKARKSGAKIAVFDMNKPVEN